MSDEISLQKQSSEGAPGLSNQEREQVEARARPNALVVHEVIRKEGEEELKRPVVGLAWSGLASGLSMGFSLMSEGLLRSHLPDAPWRPLVAKLGYCVGFLIVVLGRQQLFTENTLTPVLPWLNRREGCTLRRVLRLWGIVLAANLVGAFAFAWVAGHSGIFTPEVRRAFSDIGRESMHGGFLLHGLRGIFAGWLIALMVWLLPGADTARVGIIALITYLVGLAGLAHIIAGSVEALYVVTTGLFTWKAYWLRFMLPTLLGNTLGGVALVAALNYAQVAPEKEG